MTTRPRVVEAPGRKRVAPPKLLEIKTLVERDEDADTSYLDQDGFEDRRAEYEQGDFHFVGVRTEAEVEVAGVVQTLHSGGLWGIESDSDRSYLEEVAGEQYAELRRILKDVGVPTSELPTDLDPASIEWRT
jgi:hypothetical protein